MKKSTFYALIALAGLLLIMNIYLTINQGLVLDVKHISADANVSDHLGFMLTNDSIMHFGNLVPDTSSSRSFDLQNQFNGPILVKLYAQGKPWINFSKNNFVLEKNATERIEATVSIPPNATQGLRTWNISVVMQKAR